MRRQKESVHADARTWIVRIVAGVCALLIIGSAFAAAFM